MRVGACKDRLADAIARFGRVPIVKRTVVVRPEDRMFRDEGEAPFWAAGALVHDGRGRVLLLRHVESSGWGDVWVTPGGRLEEGETVLQGLAREVREEVGVRLRSPVLTRIFNETFMDGAHVRHGYFAQFIARASSMRIRPGIDVREARWLDELPGNLAFRDDYLEDYRRIRSATL